MRHLMTVEEVCENVTDGTHYTPKNVGIGIPFLTVKDVTDSELDFINCSFITTEDYIAAKEGNSAPKKGDVLFSKDGTVGKVHVVTTDKPFAVLSSLAILRPRQNTVDATYFGHVLRSPTVLEDALKRKTGSAIRRIILSDLKKVKIPVPSLEEQKRITDILDRAEALRAKRRAILAQLDELIQSIFIEIFGDPIKNSKNWETLKFSEVGTLQRGKSKHRPRNAPELLGGKYPLIQTGDVANSGGYITEYTQTYSELGLKQSKMWPAGTLCITIAANIAKTGILTFDACFPDSVVGFIPNEKVKIEYVQYWMSFLQKMLEESAPESAQKNINLKILFDLNIPVPPLELQTKFTSIVYVVEKIKQSHQQSLLELNNLFDSLAHEAFTGKLFSHQFFEQEIENGVKI